MKKILLIDDDEVVIDIYRKKLLKEGYDVDVAGDGLAAMRQIHTGKPDLVILDLLIPKLNGAEILKFIHSTPALQHIKIIIFSDSHLTAGELAEAKGGGHATLLKSNCLPRQLIRTVKTLLKAGDEPDSPAAPPAAPDQITDPAARPFHLPRPVPADETLEVRVRRYFIDNGAAMLANIRETSAVFAQSREPQSRSLRLGDFHRQVHFLTEAAGMAGCQRIAHLAAALEALLFELQERPKNINPSTFYTVKSAIDLLGELFARSARGDTESIPPSHMLAVLVVDDEPLANRALMQALNRANVKPTSAAAATAALELLHNYRYDLLLLDYLMPTMDGLELYERMHALPDYRKTPVIFVTSQTNFKEAHPEIIARGDDVITKPILPIELAVKSLTLLLKGRLDDRQPAPAASPAPGRVLVVDDQPLVREFVKLLLTQEGYEVETAEGAAEALATYAAGKFDLAVVDFEMPEMKGDKLAVALKSRAPRLPIIMLTGHGKKAAAEGQMPAGIDHIINKPFRLEALREGIAQAMAACAAGDTKR